MGVDESEGLQRGANDLEPLRPGQVLDARYEIVRCIKAGGMGAVYEATHRETRRRCALKTMLPSVVSDSDLRERFVQEARVAAGIESEHVVEVFDVGIDPESGRPFMVMELLRGEDLGALLRRRKRLPAEQVLTLTWQASLALDKTHDAGIVHRDLKPENLFLVLRDDGSPCLKVLDFGVAKAVTQSTLGKTTRNVGTPLFMAPEQIGGSSHIDQRADLCSLGHIVFNLLVGEPYWKREALAGGYHAVLWAIMRTSPMDSASVRARTYGVELSAAFDQWFRCATAPAVSERFESAGIMLSELARALELPLPSASVVWSRQQSSALEALETASAAPSTSGVRPTDGDAESTLVNFEPSPGGAGSRSDVSDEPTLISAERTLDVTFEPTLELIPNPKPATRSLVEASARARARIETPKRSLETPKRSLETPKRSLVSSSRLALALALILAASLAWRARPRSSLRSSTSALPASTSALPASTSAPDVVAARSEDTTLLSQAALPSRTLTASSADAAAPARATQNSSAKALGSPNDSEPSAAHALSTSERARLSERLRANTREVEGRSSAAKMSDPSDTRTSIGARSRATLARDPSDER